MNRRPTLLATLAASMAAGGVARAGTMPQLDFANPLLISQIVWGAVIFAVFYVAVSRIGLPRVGAILEMRAQRIGDDLEQARAAKQNADYAMRDLTAARKRAYAESQAEIAQAMQAAKADAEARGAEMNTRLSAQLAQSEAAIAQARAAAVGALREAATDTASAVVLRLTGQAAGPRRLDQAIRKAMRDRGLSEGAA